MNSLPVILYADSDLFMRTLVENLLADHYQVETFSNGNNLLERLHTSLPALLLLDLQLPGISSTEILSLCRQPGPLQQMYILLLSAEQDMNTKPHYIQSGASGVLCKPFHPRELLWHVGRLTSGNRIHSL